MAWTEKREGKWRGFYREASGKKRSRTFTRQRDAIQWARAEEKVQQDLTGDTMPLSAFWADYWATTKPTLRPKTIDLRESVWRKHLEPNFGNTPLERITTEHIQSWVVDMRANGLSPQTCRTYAFTLRNVLHMASQRKHIAANPFDLVVLPKVERNEMRFLTMAELKELAERAGYYKTLILFYGTVGLRFGEGAALRRSDFAPDFTSVSVTKTLGEANGKLLEGPPKTSSGRRRVGISLPIAEELREYEMDIGAGDRFFETPNSRPLRSSGFHSKVWSRIATDKFANLRPHDLRHTAISFWIHLGADAKLVASMAGHSSVKTVFDLYGHLYENADDALMRSMSEALSIQDDA